MDPDAEERRSRQAAERDARARRRGPPAPDWNDVNEDDLASILSKSLTLNSEEHDAGAFTMNSPANTRNESVKFRMLCLRTLKLQTIAHSTRTPTVALQMYKELAVLMKVDPAELRKWEANDADHFARIKDDIENRCQWFQIRPAMSHNADTLIAEAAEMELKENQRSSLTKPQGEEAPTTLYEPFLSKLARAVWYCKWAHKMGQAQPYVETAIKAIRTLFWLQHDVPATPTYPAPADRPVRLDDTRNKKYMLGDPEQIERTALGHLLATALPTPLTHRFTPNQLNTLQHYAAQYNLPEAVVELRTYEPNVMRSDVLRFAVERAVEYGNEALLLALLHRDNMETFAGYPVYVQGDAFNQSYEKVSSAQQAQMLYLPFQTIQTTETPFAPAHPDLFWPHAGTDTEDGGGPQRLKEYVDGQMAYIDTLRYKRLKEMLTQKLFFTGDPWSQERLDRFKALVNVEGRRPPNDNEATYMFNAAFSRIPHYGSLFHAASEMATPLMREWLEALGDLLPHITWSGNKKYLRGKFPLYPFPENWRTPVN